ncbi:unnamed protein product [Chrysoparadoxa australica]
MSGEKRGAEDAERWVLPPAKERKALAMQLVEKCKSRKLKVPDDEKKAVKAAGSCLMSAPKDSEGTFEVESCIQELAKKWGYLPGEAPGGAEEPEKKKSKKTEVVFTCPENEELGKILHEFGQLYFKKKDNHRGATFQKMYTAIKMCPWVITLDALPHEKKGHDRKLENVGKSGIACCKEFLETGTIAKLEELREEVEG